MSKGHEGAEKTGKTEKAEKTNGQGIATGDAKKPDAKVEHKKADAGHPVSKSKGHNPMPGGCFCWGCKGQAFRFNFCAEHYEHFKFGLIKKTGEPVPDYEKKFEHYTAFKAKKGAHRAA